MTAYVIGAVRVSSAVPSPDGVIEGLRLWLAMATLCLGGLMAIAYAAWTAMSAAHAAAQSVDSTVVASPSRRPAPSVAPPLTVSRVRSVARPTASPLATSPASPAPGPLAPAGAAADLSAATQPVDAASLAAGEERNVCYQSVAMMEYVRLKDNER